MHTSPHSSYYRGAGQGHLQYGSGHASYSSPVAMGHPDRCAQSVAIPGAPGSFQLGMHPGQGGLIPLGSLQGPMRSDESTMAQGLSSLNKPVEDMFPVRIDTYTASKEAGDKRQKNADASARYRRRKADQAAEEKSKMAQLQEENRYLGGRVIELTRQREFYRSERQALRELLLTVPALKDAAKNRPPTPLPPFDEH